MTAGRPVQTLLLRLVAASGVVAGIADRAAAAVIRRPLVLVAILARAAADRR